MIYRTKWIISRSLKKEKPQTQKFQYRITNIQNGHKAYWNVGCDYIWGHVGGQTGDIVKINLTKLEYCLLVEDWRNDFEKRKSKIIMDIKNRAIKNE